MATFHLSSGWEGLWIAVDQGSTNQVHRYLRRSLHGLVCPALHGEGQIPQESFTGSIQVEVGIKGAVHLPHGTMALWFRGLHW